MIIEAKGIPLPKFMRKAWFYWFLLFLFIAYVMLCANAEAAQYDFIRSKFASYLSQFVGKMTSSGSAINKFAWAMFAFLSMAMFIQQYLIFIRQPDPFEHMMAMGYWFIGFGLMASYDIATQTFWGIAEGLSYEMQSSFVGNNDPLFILQWIRKVTMAIKVSDVGIFDALDMVALSFCWLIIGIALDCVMYLGSIWAVFGYGLAKIVGFLFIPFILLKGTRNLFDGWVRFFTGFIVLAVVVKVTGILGCLIFQAQLESIGVGFTSVLSDPQNVVEIGEQNIGYMTEIIGTGIVAILFVLSAFKFAASLAAGVGSAGGGFGAMIKMGVKAATGKVV
ncbi:type IV secretion system protein [Klebsiella pneumoniae]|nr:type IV secretion system protein [Klebsiella pneumoniae]